MSPSQQNKPALSDILSVTVLADFSYGHYLPAHKGKCFNQHGHNADIEVEVGAVYSDLPLKDGMIIDFADLKKIVKEQVVDLLDHKNLNDLDYEELRENPTAENMTLFIVRRLKGVLGDNLLRVRVWETKKGYAEWKSFLLR